MGGEATGEVGGEETGEVGGEETGEVGREETGEVDMIDLRTRISTFRYTFSHTYTSNDF